MITKIFVDLNSAVPYNIFFRILNMAVGFVMKVTIFHQNRAI